MIYGYVRVSTEKQTVKNQKLEIQKYAKIHKMHNILWIAETISGTKTPEQRKLGNLIKTAQSGDTIIITELSRLGRSMIMILDVLNELLEKNVMVYAIKENYELGNNIQSKVLAFAFGLSAELERTLISERTKQGIQRARKQGKQIGRKRGQLPVHYKLTGKGMYIKRMRLQGVSKSELARNLNVTWCTLDRFMKRKNIM